MLLAGVDEAGVGPLMGDLVAAAVVLPTEGVEGVADSKKLSAKRRSVLAERVRAAATCAIGSVSAQEIDTHGMAWARRAVFHRALDALSVRPDKIIVDGTLFEPWHDVPYECIPRADATVPAVGAASILAKVERDARVEALCKAQPEMASRYGWAKNKGYPTPQHLNALKEHGATEFHRHSFGPCK